MAAQKVSPTASRAKGWSVVFGVPHLYRRGGSGKLYARVRIPPSAGLQGTHKERSLRTADMAEAKRRLPHVVAELKADIEAARRDPSGAVKGGSRMTPDEEAAWWRDRLRAEALAPPSDPNVYSEREAFTERLHEIAGEPMASELEEDGSEVVEVSRFNPERERLADEMQEAVIGHGLTVGAELERYFAQTTHTLRYQSRTRLAVRRLGGWLKAERGQDRRELVTRYVAGLFIDHLSATSTSAVTAGSYLSSLCSYWRWMIAKGVMPKGSENPWQGQPRPVVKNAKEGEKRPFTDAEVVTLLAGETYSTLHDLMRVAALSGMRVGEIGRLSVSECAGGVFDITATKTEAGVRKVPIHPALKALVERRSKGKAADAYLFDELKAPPSRPRERTGKASERFTAYRRAMKVDARAEGQRQSDVDFHSFRRWFVTKAEQAGQPPHLISAVVGHAEGRQGMTLGTYSGGPSEAQRRAVVEAVVLPKGAPVESPGGQAMGAGVQRK